MKISQFSREFNPTYDTAVSDYKDAFQNIHRDTIIAATDKYCPTLSTMTSRTLNAQSKGWYCGLNEGVESITTAEGVPQGAVKSPFDFGVATLDFNCRLNSIVSTGGGNARSYLDDMRATGKEKDVISMIQLQQSEGPSIGLHLQMAKEKILLGKKGSYESALSAQQRFHLLGIPLNSIHLHPLDSPTSLSSCGYIHMGIGIGTDSYVADFLISKKEALRQEFQAIYKVTSKQVAYRFLHQIIPHKVTHILRGLPLRFLGPFITEYNSLQRSCLSHILEVDSIGDISYDIARAENGGGLVFLKDVAEPAFTASCLAAFGEVKDAIPAFQDVLRYATDHWAKDDDHSSTWFQLRSQWDVKYLQYPLLEDFFHGLRVLQCESSSIPSLSDLLEMPESGMNKLQHRLIQHRNAKRSESIFSILEDKHDSAGLAVFQSSSTKESKAWLWSVPTSPSMSMSNGQFTTAVRTRFLVDHPSILPNTRCKCKGSPSKASPILDTRGYHSQKCKLEHHLTIATHEQLKLEIMSLIRFKGVPCHSNCNGIFAETNPEDGCRGDIVELGTGGVRTIYDVRLSNPVSAVVERGGRVGIGDSTNTSEKEKWKKYGERCKSVRSTFIPLCVDTTGYWGKSFSRWFEQTIAFILKDKNQDISNVSNYWTRRISIAIQRGVSDAINSRIRVVYGGGIFANDDISVDRFSMQREGGRGF